MATYQIGFKPSDDPTSSLGATSRTQSALQIDLTEYGNSISSRHLVAANQRIFRMHFFARAVTNGVSGSVTMAAYVADSSTNVAGARVGAKSTITTDSNVSQYYSVDVDIPLDDYIGQYIKPAGGYTVGLRPYYVTATSGHNVYSTSDCPTPMGSVTNGVNLMAMYMEIEDVDVDPRINPTGTDTTLTVGATHSIVFAGLTSNPVSVAIVRDGVTAAQSDFVLGTVTDGSATAAFTATIGNLPYTDTTYPSSGYSYLATCADDSELTFDDISIAPQDGNSFVTAVDPVNDATSILYSWIEGGAVTGDQVDYPVLLNPVYDDEDVLISGITLTVRPDFTFYGVSVDGTFPDSVSFQVGYWDSVSEERWYSTIIVAFDESGDGTVIGFSSRGFTEVGLTVRGFTSRGF